MSEIIGQALLLIVVSLLVGAIAGFYFARWLLGKKLQEIEKNYQESVRKSYQEMGSFFGRKIKEEDLNRITTQMKEETKKEKKPNPVKTKIKRKKRK